MRIMSESKTKCTDCGAAILQRTADRHEGRCVRCYHKAAAIPPPSFELAGDLVERLTALNENPGHFREDAWRWGADSVHRYLDKVEERNALYREWSPRLLTFARNCRVQQPHPDEESLSHSFRAKQRICEEQFKHSRPVLGRILEVAICSMPLLAIPVAQRIWAPADDRTVLLTAEEEAQWDEIYSHPEGSFEWFARFWWRIDDSPAREFSLSEGRTFVRWDERDVQEGENPWLVKVGHCYGPRAGAGHVELWSWNGTEAKFIKKVSNWIS
jgi:hypothetical protein